MLEEDRRTAATGVIGSKWKIVRFVDPIPPSIRITSPDQSKEALVVSYLVMDYYAYWE